MSELTGRIRYRDGRFGGLVLQVEYQWTGMPVGSRDVVTEPRWRDADWPDLMELQTHHRPPRQRIFGVERKQPDDPRTMRASTVTHASNQPHHQRS